MSKHKLRAIVNFSDKQPALEGAAPISSIEEIRKVYENLKKAGLGKGKFEETIGIGVVQIDITIEGTEQDATAAILKLGGCFHVYRR